VQGGEFHADDATVTSLPYYPNNPSQPAAQRPTGQFTPHNPQKLVLRSDPNNQDYGMEGANEATSMVDAPNYGRRAPGSPLYPNQGVSNPGYPPQGASHPGYPPQAGAYQDYRTQDGGPYPGQGASYAGYAPQSGGNFPPGGVGYVSPSGPYQGGTTPAPASNSKGRVASLILILLGLLFMLGALVLFTLKHNGFFGGTSTSNSFNAGTTIVGTQNTPVSQNTPIVQAEATVQRLYDDVNQHDYNAAYNQWYNYPKTLTQFKNGYAHTRHDDLTIDNSTALSDGTVKVFVTVIATEDAQTGTKQSQFKGYYIVGQENGKWLLLSGQLNPA
jgi:hypothetical protein